MTDQECISKLSGTEKFYAVYCNYTRMPYVECEEETFSDMTFLFLDEEKAKEFAMTHKGGKMSLTAVKVEQNTAKHFFSSLIAEGFDMVCVLEKETHYLLIDQLVKRTLKEGAKKPIENPSLQLSMMYFLQTIQSAQTEEEKEESKNKEEEMMANIARAIYLVPFREIEGEVDGEDGSRNVSLIHLQNEAKEVFIPLFTDMDEFLKINPGDGTTSFYPMSFQNIKEVKRDRAVGFVINPGSVNLQLNQNNFDAVDSRFGNQSK